MNQPNLFNDSKQSKEDIPKLNQCFLCKGWSLESNLSPVAIPDQGNGYVPKLACSGCLSSILEEK
jgi:hypothetical protein